MTGEPIRFRVPGHPISQGSKNPVALQYKDGTPVRNHREECHYHGVKGKTEYLCRCPIMVNVLDDHEKDLRPWRESIALVARIAMQGQEPLDGLIVAGYTFFLHRPKNHYGSGRNERVLRRDAPAAPGVMPDSSKLRRAVEDAMSGVVFTDDSRVVTGFDAKRYVHPWEEECVEVVAKLAEVQTVADLIAAGALLTEQEELGQLGLLDPLAL